MAVSARSLDGELAGENSVCLKFSGSARCMYERGEGMFLHAG